MADYKSTALAYARDRELTPEQVAEWSYQATATAAKVTIEENGNSPVDFFFEHIRRYVWTVLAKERDDFRREACRVGAETGIRAVPGESDTTVTIGDDGKFVISSIGDHNLGVSP